MAKPTIYIDDSYIAKDGTCKLYVRYYIGKSYVRVPAGVSVEPGLFNKDTFVVKGKSAKEKNLLIQDILGRAAKVILKYQVNNKTLSKDLFRKELENPAVLVEFYAYVVEQIKIRQGTITESTIEQQLSIVGKFNKFKSNLLLIEIDENLLLDYQKYLYRKLNLDVNSVYNNMKVIKTYVGKAFKSGLIEEDPFKFIKLKKVQKMPTFLSEQERDQLLELYYSNRLTEQHKKVLRWFLFVCFTGLRISDLTTIKHEQIKRGMLIFNPVKSQNINYNQIELPLSKTAKKLINEENPLRAKGLIFDCYSHPRMNKYLKEACEVIHLDKKISFHTGRHTFATIFLQKYDKANGILILQKLLGHSNLSSTLIYTHVLDADVRDAINKFD